ncbi:MAG: histidinol dehydrogenase [Acidimicrobiales bacterium]
MLKRLDVRGVPIAELRNRLPKPIVAGDEPVAAVREILAAVEARGDAAVREYTERFDRVRLEQLRVPPEAVRAALDQIDPTVRAALEAAAVEIEAFQRSTLVAPHTHTGGGVTIRSWRQPVARAGCYVPGGRAIYPSTVLMTAIPAKVAGVGEVVLCVPPERGTGTVPAVTLAAAAVAGVDEVYAIGGAQAIGALAFGTESIRAVDVIVGPGNVYVAVAKREVAGRGLVAIPSAFAGPSEVVVIADETVPAEFAAIDVIVQAEHGPDGLAWLVCWSDPVADAVGAAIERLVETAPRRAEILSTLDLNGYAVVCDDAAQAVEVANVIAPEHLELLCGAAVAEVGRVRNAGAIFLGPHAPASVGDYAAGPSHTLPTDGSARFSSVLSVDDFTKHMHTIEVDPAGFERLAPHVVALARAEGFDAHASSITLRQAAR